MPISSPFPPATWRVIYHPPGDGAWNMAVDEAILEHARRGEVPPTLRLYAWQPPCLSLGYAQPIADADLERLHTRGWQIVRRPTGGRAILHTDELTYSVAGPESEPRLSGGVLDAYQRLAQALLTALHLLGVPAEALPAKSPTSKDQPPICFEVPSHYEITIAGKKLIGSAQSRKRGGVLQHGSLPLEGDITRIVQALRFPDEAARTRAAERLQQRATTLEACLGQSVSWEQAAQALTDAFATSLNLTLKTGELTSSEQTRAKQLRAEKYTHPTWLHRR